MEGNDNKKKAVLVSILSVVLVALAVVGSIVLMKSCNVDVTPVEVNMIDATSDEAKTSDSTGDTDSDVPVTDGTPTLPNGEPYTLTQDIDALRNINEEIRFWIDIPGTDVSYPVLRHEEDSVGNHYYLHRNYDKTYLFAGSVYIDYRSKKGENSRNILTHGHNMNNGTMYADLVDYGEYTGDMKAYKNAPTIFLHTENGVEQWVIFSVFKTSTLERHGEFFNYLLGEFSSDAQYMNYIYNVKERSLFDIPVPINENDRLLTLSTCSYEYSDFRTVVVARKVRAGENVSEYISNAKLNENPLWPDVYYTDHYEDKPELTTFKTEYTAGKIDWYDGEGKLSGNEWLPVVAGQKTYTVSFTDYNGNIIKTQTVTAGKDAVPPEDPQRPDDDYYIYEFAGWQLDYTNVRRNMIIAPSYTPILKEQYR